MKNLIIIISSIVIISVLGYFAYSYTQKDKAQNNTNNNQQENTQQEETNTKEVDLKVTVPEGWNPVEGSVLPVQYMKNTSSFMIKTENYGTKNLNEIVTKSLEIFSSAFTDVKQIGNAQDLKIDGYDAKAMTFTAKVSGLEMKYMYVYTVVEGELYAITFGDLSTSFDKLTTDYETILKNITF